MQQLTFNDEEQRSLTSEAVAGFRFAQSGVDSLQSGTSDNYTWSLSYVDSDTGADIVIDFDNAETSFAVSSANASFISANDARLNSAPIFFNNSFNWFFNQVSNEVDTSNLFVKFDAGVNGSGGETSPFNNLADAVSVLDSGSTANTINIEPGSSSETFTGGSTITKAMTILNNDSGSGNVLIGP